MNKISDLITKKERKRNKKFRELTDEEFFILRKHRIFNKGITIIIVLYFMFYYPIQILIETSEKSSLILSLLIFDIVLICEAIPLFFIIFILYLWYIKFFDKYKKERKIIIKKLKDI